MEKFLECTVERQGEIVCTKGVVYPIIEQNERSYEIKDDKGTSCFIEKRTLWQYFNLIVKENVPNGHIIEYKVNSEGTAYHRETPSKVVGILEDARRNGTRIRVFYGDSKTGKCWLEEHDIIGYIGRSCGTIKVPLLLSNSESRGGGAILDHCIVKITIDKRVAYQHPNFNIGNFITSPIIGDLAKDGYTTSVSCDGATVANFKDETRARNYIAFMKGERNRT